VHWILPFQDVDIWRAFVNTVMKVMISYNSGDFLNTWGAISFSKMTLPRSFIRIVPSLLTSYP